MSETPLNNGWISADLDPRRILLDPENARINAPGNARNDASDDDSQDELRLQLLRIGRVIDLARSFITHGGIIPGERIIVTKEGRRYIVLEGNRRTCAAQLLLEPNLIPKEFKAQFPALSDDGTRKNLLRLWADVAPTREAADLAITLRHTSASILRWSPTAQHRRMLRLVEKGQSLDDVARQFVITKHKLRRYLQDAELLQTVYELELWKDAEKETLGKPDLKTNAFTRFFQLSGVKEALGITFEDNGKVQTDLSDKKFLKAMEHIARQLLLPAPGGGSPPSNTRTSPQALFERIADKHTLLRDLPERLKAKPTNGSGSRFSSTGDSPTASQNTSSPATGPQPSTKGSADRRASPAPKKIRFFEELNCTISDEVMSGMAAEIRFINHTKFPYAATYLLRALHEKCLERCLKKSKMWGKMMQEHTASGGVNGREPGLKAVLTFCQNNHDQIFDQDFKRLISQWLSGQKDYVDLVVHGKMIKAHGDVLEQIASYTRPFIAAVLNDSLPLKQRA